MRRCTTIAAGVVRCGTWSSSAVVIGAHCVTSGPVRIGIGLPNTVPGGGDVLTPWARLADEGPFSSLGVLDRIVFDSLDPFAGLAAAAAVTGRISLVTMVAIGPLRPAVLLAKQAASVDALSGGRLVLGLSIGAREDDYTVTGVSRG